MTGVAFTVGYTVTPTGSTSNSWTVQEVFGIGPFTMPADGVLQSCSLWLRTAGGTTSFTLGVYGPQATSQPGVLLAKTAQFATATGWVTHATLTNPTIPAGTVIWMAGVDTANDGTTQDTPTGIELITGATSVTTLGTPFGTATVNTNPWATGIYATFIPPDVPFGQHNMVSWTYG